MDLCARSIAVAPSEHLSNRLGLALDDHLHPAVLCVLGPSTQVEFLHLALQRIQEGSFLHDTAGDEDVRP